MGKERNLLIFVGWTVLSLVLAGYAINRDLTGE